MYVFSHQFPFVLFIYLFERLNERHYGMSNFCVYCILLNICALRV